MSGRDVGMPCDTSRRSSTLGTIGEPDRRPVAGAVRGPRRRGGRAGLRGPGRAARADGAARLPGACCATSTTPRTPSRPRSWSWSARPARLWVRDSLGPLAPPGGLSRRVLLPGRPPPGVARHERRAGRPRPRSAAEAEPGRPRAVAPRGDRPAAGEVPRGGRALLPGGPDPRAGGAAARLAARDGPEPAGAGPATAAGPAGPPRPGPFGGRVRAALAAERARAEVPAALAEATARAGCTSRRARRRPGRSSAAVMALTEGVLRTMSLTRLKMTAVAVLIGFGMARALSLIESLPGPPRKKLLALPRPGRRRSRPTRRRCPTGRLTSGPSRCWSPCATSIPGTPSTAPPWPAATGRWVSTSRSGPDIGGRGCTSACPRAAGDTGPRAAGSHRPSGRARPSPRPPGGPARCSRTAPGCHGDAPAGDRDPGTARRRPPSSPRPVAIWQLCDSRRAVRGHGPSRRRPSDSSDRPWRSRSDSSSPIPIRSSSGATWPTPTKGSPPSWKRRAVPAEAEPLMRSILAIREACSPAAGMPGSDRRAISSIRAHSSAVSPRSRASG